jgi:RimJ/RimL family protein N-acetyltransferase
MGSVAERFESDPLRGSIDTGAIGLSWSEAQWDSAVFGYPVVQISRIEARDGAAAADLAPFVAARAAGGVGLASCRLSCERLRESMLLEEIGFCFIEMVYQPEFGDLQSAGPGDAQGLEVVRAGAAQLAEIVAVAGAAFGNERFHVDPRLSSRLGDLRYQNWVRSSLDHPTQRLYAVCEGGQLVAFFVTELLVDGTCYWHLNAVAPARQGRGYGMRAWRAMMHQARVDGASRVRTSIVARNHRVLNLYARLGFNFPAPSMTFHWVRPQ